MIKNSLSKREKMKQIILEQIAFMYPNEEESIKNVTLCNMNENIFLWKLELTNKTHLYLYTNWNGNILFNGTIFPYASPFSNSCALVELKTLEENQSISQYYIIDVAKKEFVQIPMEEMNGKVMYHIRNGNVAMYGQNNHWGSYFYDPENNHFIKDIPFIWDTLEFSKDGKNVAAGLCSSKVLVNSDNWEPDKVELKIKVMNTFKEYAYTDALYQQFLRYIYDNQLPCREITSDNKTILTPQRKENFVIKYYDLYEYETEHPILNQCTNDLPSVIDSINLEEYKRVRGRVIK